MDRYKNFSVPNSAHYSSNKCALWFAIRSRLCAANVISSLLCTCSFLLIAYECRTMICLYTLATLILCAQHVASRKCFSSRNQWYDLGHHGSIRTGSIAGCRLPNANFSRFLFYVYSCHCEVLERSQRPTITGRLVAACNRILCTVFFAGPSSHSVDLHCKLGGTLVILSPILFYRLSCFCNLRRMAPHALLGVLVFV